jgi:hypothetical protein
MHCGTCSTMCDVDNGESCHEGVCDLWGQCGDETYLSVTIAIDQDCWGGLHTDNFNCVQECCDDGVKVTLAGNRFGGSIPGDPNNCGGCGITCGSGLCMCSWEGKYSGEPIECSCQ